MGLKNIINKLSGAVLYNILGSLFGILSTILISRYYGSDKLGTISLCLKITQILTVICLFGFRQQIIKDIAIYFNQKDSLRASLLLNNVKLFSRISSFLTTGFVFGILYFLPFLFNKDENFVRFMQIFIFSLIFIVQTKNNTFVLISIGKFKKSVLFDGFYNTLFVVLLLLSVILLNIKVTIEILALIFFLSRFFNYLMSIYSFKKSKFFTNKKRIDTSLIKKGKDFFFNSVIITINSNIDIIIISIILTPNLVAIYAVCTRISQIINLVTQVLSKVVSPEIANYFYDNKINKLKILVSKYMLLSLLIAIVFSSLGLLFSTKLLNLWGSDFSIYSTELIIMIIATSIGFIFSPYANLLSMTGYQKLELKLNIYVSMVYLCSLIMLTFYYGLIGSSIAFFIKTFSINFFKYMFSNQILKKAL
jgi:O-antigen/teichoic acid export membrane protein